MVRRLLAGLLLMAAILTAAPVTADDGLTPPPVSGRQTLADRYPPDTLHFYTEDASWYEPGKATKNALTTVLAALFQFVAMIVKWTLRAVEYAWEFNITRWFGGSIDAVAGRFGKLVWSFGGLMFTFLGGWVALQVWRGAMGRMAAGLAVVAVVLGIAVWTQAGLSKIVADVEDIGSDLAGEILTTGAEGETAGAVVGLSDGLYRQMIIEQWARANFASLEAANKPEYVREGLPGGRFLGLPPDKAANEYKMLSEEQRQDLSPWHSDGAISRRIAVTLNTILSVLLFLPILLLLSLFVLGTKALTVFFAMGFPLALFVAAMPWFDGIRFLKGYTIWVFISPMVKMFGAVFLAIYMAFLGGLMSSATAVPGGWATVTLIMGALALTLWLLGRPLLRLFSSLLFRPKVERTVEPRHRDRSHSTERYNAPVHRSRAPLVVMSMTPRRLKQKAGEHATPAHADKQGSAHVRQPQQKARAQPEIDLLALLREFRRATQAVAKTVEKAGRRR